MNRNLNTHQKPHFTFPKNGDFVNKHDGVEKDGELELSVTVKSSPGCTVTIGGTPAVESSGIYTANLCLREGKNSITAKNLNEDTEAEITVFYSTKTVGKYRISSDDNILFLADITKHQDVYTSIFDNPYLAVYKKAHDLYGAKVHLNLFYAFDRASAECFTDERPDFDLSMMTDKFKAEWESNSDWLTLSPHARQEFPDKPYKHAKPEEITRDFSDIEREIVRFAGEKTLSSGVVTVHWGEANVECVRALRAMGYTALMGYFELDEAGEPLVSYYMDVPKVNYVGERDFFRDFDTDVTFGRIDRVTNIGSLSEIMDDMHAITAHSHRGCFVSIMIHEQYFYPDYVNYLPDFEARVLEPAKHLFSLGYNGSFVSEVLNVI